MPYVQTSSQLVYSKGTVIRWSGAVKLKLGLPAAWTTMGPKNEQIHGMARGNWVTLRGLLLERAVYVLYDQYPLVN